MEKVVDLIREVKQSQEQPFCAYIYDLDALKEHASAVVRPLPENVRLFYAMKANSEHRILQQLKDVVHGFETASIGEIKKAREADPHIPIIFGGPGKTDEELRGAIEHNVKLIHIESIQELQRLEWIAGTMERQVSVLLRMNINGPLPSATLQMAGTPTQFGIHESEIESVLLQAASCAHVKIEGFHLHCISNQLDAEKHAELMDVYFTKVKEWEQAYRLQVSYINVGGGIGVNYSNLQAQFQWDTFVNGLKQCIDRHQFHNKTILFECGRYIAASCGYYAVEVLDIKENHGKTFVIVRGGTHHFRLPVSWQHSHPYKVLPIENWKYPFKRKERTDENVTIVGQLCTPKDVLAKDVRIDKLRIGDVIVFVYAGAYGWSISHHDFLSHPHPEHIYVSQTTPSPVGR
ncbi:MAG: diaminopimelate decarboxylase [Paenibacillus sp.]|jgi:diaminopimelate decarboxylase|nr:diaminopimelate decarboxylase [Paenibacillus sp.]